MRIFISKKFKFEAAHHLPNYEGDCHNMHGHSYTGEVVISKDSNDVMGSKSGMVMDYKELKKIIDKGIVAKYDHQDLNNFFSNPTAEIMLEKIWEDMWTALPNGGRVILEKVVLNETDGSSAWIERYK